jgi:hypothetical protein
LVAVKAAGLRLLVYSLQRGVAAQRTATPRFFVARRMGDGRPAVSLGVCNLESRR